MPATPIRPTSRTVRNRLLRLLPPAELDRLWPRLEPVDLSLKSVLMAPGAAVESAHFVEAGTVSMVAMTEDGTQIEVGLVGSEGMTGLPLLLGASTSALEGVVQVSGTALRLPAAAFRAVLAEVPSLLGLLLRYADRLRDALSLAAARVQSVAQVHAAPAPYGIVPELSLDDHLGSLRAALARAMGAEGARRSVRVEVEPLAVSSSAAQRLGLLVTELVTNALRHAFRPDQPGTVRVTGARRDDGSYRLCVADDGKGLPRDFDSRPQRPGLGLRLVNVLASQLRARLTVEGHTGARFILVLPASMVESEGNLSGSPT